MGIDFIHHINEFEYPDIELPVSRETKSSGAVSALDFVSRLTRNSTLPYSKV